MTTYMYSMKVIECTCVINLIYINHVFIILFYFPAFTTWFFGAMFYIIGNPLSNEVLLKSIEVQACMLRILSAHHSITFTKISMKYISILEGIY